MCKFTYPPHCPSKIVVGIPQVHANDFVNKVNDLFRTHVSKIFCACYEKNDIFEFSKNVPQYLTKHVYKSSIFQSKISHCCTYFLLNFDVVSIYILFELFAKKLLCKTNNFVMHQSIGISEILGSPQRILVHPSSPFSGKIPLTDPLPTFPQFKQIRSVHNFKNAKMLKNTLFINIQLKMRSFIFKLNSFYGNGTFLTLSLSISENNYDLVVR